MEKVIEELLDRQTGIERLFEGVVLALDERGMLPLSSLLPVLVEMQANARMTEGDQVGDCMGFVIDRLGAHCEVQATGAQALDTVRAQTAELSRIPAELRQAQLSWLAIATPDEIAAELDPSLHLPLPASGASGKRPESDQGEPGKGDG